VRGQGLNGFRCGNTVGDLGALNIVGHLRRYVESATTLGETRVSGQDGRGPGIGAALRKYQ